MTNHVTRYDLMLTEQEVLLEHKQISAFQQNNGMISSVTQSFLCCCPQPLNAEVSEPTKLGAAKANSTLSAIVFVAHEPVWDLVMRTGMATSLGCIPA